MQKGDFLLIEYVGKIQDTGEIFDLTDAELAKKEGIHNPQTKYGPQLVILGAAMTVPGVEKNLLEMKVGDEREFDVSRTQGFGNRDPRLIKIISYQKFISQKMNPVPGSFVQIDGRNAKIQSVSGGRVRVDFNSPLAGKDLHYKVKIAKHLKTSQDKAQAMMEHYGLEGKALLKEKNLDIVSKQKVPDQFKQILNMQLTKYLKDDVKKINYINPKDSKVRKLPTKIPASKPKGQADQKPKPDDKGAAAKPVENKTESKKEKPVQK